VDTFIIADASDIIVLDTSNNPKLSQQLQKSAFVKIFAPIFMQGKLTASAHTSVLAAKAINIIENPDISAFSITTKYSTIQDTKNLKPPS
jgi:hypothetical protein